MPNQYAQAAPICNRPEGPGVKVEARSSATCGPMSPGVLHARCDAAPGAVFQGQVGGARRRRAEEFSLRATVKRMNVGSFYMFAGMLLQCITH